MPHAKSPRAARCFTLLLLVCGMVACDKPQDAFKATDVTGADFARDFKLTDHNGNERTLADFRGKAVVVFFGYLHCPDFCPTTLSQLAKAVQALGEDGKRVQVLFITVDPERDTREVLSRYVATFNSSFLGMSGSIEDIRHAAKEFRILFEKSPGSTTGEYSVDHSTGTYVFDPSGRLRLYVAYGTDADSIAHDLAILLKSK